MKREREEMNTLRGKENYYFGRRKGSLPPWKKSIEERKGGGFASYA